MKNKLAVVTIAAASFALSTAALATTTVHKTTKTTTTSSKGVKCYGVNKCSGKGGSASCQGKGSVNVVSKKDCEDLGGATTKPAAEATTTMPTAQPAGTATMPPSSPTTTGVQNQ